MTTGRSPTVGGADSLQAKFDAQSFGGRLEGGYRIATRWMVDITPYAAVQGRVFTPRPMARLRQALPPIHSR